MDQRQTEEPRKQTLGRVEMPGGPADLRLWSRPNDHKDQAVVGMVTVKAPLLHS